MTVKMKCVDATGICGLTHGRVYEGVNDEPWFRIGSNDNGYAYDYALARFKAVTEAAEEPREGAYLVVANDGAPFTYDNFEDASQDAKERLGHIYKLYAEAHVEVTIKTV